MELAEAAREFEAIAVRQREIGQQEVNGAWRGRQPHCLLDAAGLEHMEASPAQDVHLQLPQCLLIFHY
jgi:hypothetical protein